jgi:hypothetical protein
MLTALRTGRWLLFTLAVLLQPAVQADDIIYNGEAAVAFDNNINNAARHKDIREDAFFVGRFGAGYGVDLNEYSGFFYSANISTEAHSDFDGLNFFAGQASVDYKTRPGSSFLSPAYSVGLSIKEKLSSSDIRDSTTFDLKFEMFKRLTDLTSLIAGAAYSVEEAEGDVFDLSRARVYANVDLLLDAKSTIFITYIYVDGDVVSVGTPDSLQLLQAADALEPDDAFGDGSVTGAIAYRLDAKTHILNFGYNMALDHGSSIDISVRVLTSSAGGGIDYNGTSLRAGYLIQFK